MSSVESRISGTVTASTTPKAIVLQQWSADMSKRRPREDAGVEQDAQAAAGFGGFGGGRETLNHAHGVVDGGEGDQGHAKRLPSRARTVARNYGLLR